MNRQSSSDGDSIFVGGLAQRKRLRTGVARHERFDNAAFAWRLSG